MRTGGDKSSFRISSPLARRLCSTARGEFAQLSPKAETPLGAYPWPFAYALTSERNAPYMTWQVGCSAQWTSGSPPVGAIVRATKVRAGWRLLLRLAAAASWRIAGR